MITDKDIKDVRRFINSEDDGTIVFEHLRIFLDEVVELNHRLWSKEMFSTPSTPPELKREVSFR